MIVLNIACVTGTIFICAASAITLFFAVWGVLWLLEKLYFRLFTSKESTYSRNYTKPKFYSSVLTKYIINLINSISDHFHEGKRGVFSHILRQSRRREQSDKTMIYNQIQHGDTKGCEPPESLGIFSPCSHATTLPQEKEGNNENGTLP